MRPPGLSRAVKEVWHKASLRIGKPAVRSPNPSNPASAFARHEAPSPVSDFVRSVYKGVFRPLAQNGPVSPRVRLAPRHVPLTSTVASLRGTGLRASARRTQAFKSSPWPSHTSQVGLQSARAFSTSPGAFANVVSNVPLALRALANEGGIDERKWRKTVHTLRKAEVKRIAAQRGNKRLVDPVALQQAFKTEFAQYWQATTAEREGVPAAASTSCGCALVAPLEPEYQFASSDSAALEDYRLLDQPVLGSIKHLTDKFTIHAQRLRGLINRLTKHGVFDDPSVRVELVFHHRKELRIEFLGPQWTLDKVRLVALDETTSWTAQWFDIYDLDEYVADGDPLLDVERACQDAEQLQVDATLSTASYPLTITHSSWLDESDSLQQSTFVMPDPTTSSYLSPDDENEGDDLYDSVASIAYVDSPTAPSPPSISEHEWHLSDPWSEAEW